MSKIIAMAGQMGSGKDTAAKYLVEEHGYTRIAFADNLKEMCKHVFSLTDEDVYGEKGKFKEFKNPVALDGGHVLEVMKWAGKNGFPISDDMQESLYKMVGQKFKTPREILQFVGTEMCREVIHNDFHAEVVRLRIEREELEKVVISDCRFLNERKAIKEWGGENVLIIGRSTEHKASAFSKGHASENSLGDESEYDVIIENSGTLDELYDQVEELIV